QRQQSARLAEYLRPMRGVAFEVLIHTGRLSLLRLIAVGVELLLLSCMTSVMEAQSPRRTRP
ncbi:MAG: hypothetical protein SXG53_20725, partial [Pseudomonadota bacterium]|nr:hypothetical protein [Pseudomonadota bacterium]